MVGTQTLTIKFVVNKLANIGEQTSYKVGVRIISSSSKEESMGELQSAFRLWKALLPVKGHVAALL